MNARDRKGARMKKFFAFLVDWFQQSFIAVDQAFNAIVTPLFTFTVGYADETLSARIYRTAKDGNRFALAVMPAADALFAWQSVDPTIRGSDGQPIKPHCERAYWKEKLRRQSPPEERGP